MQVVAGGVLLRYVWTHNYPTDTADTAAAGGGRMGGDVT